MRANKEETNKEEIMCFVVTVLWSVDELVPLFLCSFCVHVI